MSTDLEHRLRTDLRTAADAIVTTPPLWREVRASASRRPGRRVAVGVGVGVLALGGAGALASQLVPDDVDQFTRDLARACGTELAGATRPVARADAADATSRELWIAPTQSGQVGVALRAAGSDGPVGGVGSCVDGDAIGWAIVSGQDDGVTSTVDVAGRTAPDATAVTVTLTDGTVLSGPVGDEGWFLLSVPATQASAAAGVASVTPG